MDHVTALKSDETIEAVEIPVESAPLISGATHLFEEPGTLERVAALAAGWFERYLRGGTLGPRSMEN